MSLETIDYFKNMIKNLENGFYEYLETSSKFWEIFHYYYNYVSFI